ncbi:MAG TPA: hypothetical protein VKZ63_13370, partial [Kofleriaceae bacterium]|nr:hypothetical protein [Kofleriaceae bacterium]
APPIPDLVDRRALLCARAELARTGPGALATAGRLYRRVLAPAASLAVAAAHLVWVLDAVASLYR